MVFRRGESWWKHQLFFKFWYFWHISHFSAGVLNGLVETSYVAISEVFSEEMHAIWLDQLHIIIMISTLWKKKLLINSVVLMCFQAESSLNEIKSLVECPQGLQVSCAYDLCFFHSWIWPMFFMGFSIHASLYFIEWAWNRMIHIHVYSLSNVIVVDNNSFTDSADSVAQFKNK